MKKMRRNAGTPDGGNMKVEPREGGRHGGIRTAP
jgi:hypothetical protein